MPNGLLREDKARILLANDELKRHQSEDQDAIKYKIHDSRNSIWNTNMIK